MSHSYGLMSTFVFTLIKDHKEVMTLELGLSFFASFFDFVSRYFLSPCFSSDQTSKLELPNSYKGPKCFSIDIMRIATLRDMSVTYASIFENISFDSSYGLLLL
jgi:hypothetical protein